MSVRKSILTFFMCMFVATSLAGQSVVYFSEIPLGTDYRAFKKALKRQGYALKKEWKDNDDLCYGLHKGCLLEGKFDGEPALVRLRASHKTQKVFAVTLELVKCIDMEEAIEVGDRVRANFHAFYNSIGLVRYEESKHKDGFTMFLYSDETALAQGKYYGSIHICIYGSFHDDYTVCFNFQSNAIRRLALDEADIDNSWIIRPE